MGWVAPVLGMVQALLIEIAALLAIQTLLMIWGGRQVVAIVNQGLMGLDQSVAEALKQIIEGGVGDFEPQNPILAAIASRMMAQTEAPMVELRPKDNKGRFI